MSIHQFAVAAAVLAALGLGACQTQQNIEGTQSQYINVEGKRMKVDLKPTGVPGEFTLLAVRDAMVVNPDPESEIERGQAAATRVMREVCGVKGLNPQVLDHQLVRQINYHVRFKCV